MKFQKVIPKDPWTKERTQAQIDSTMSDIKEMNKTINLINSQIIDLTHKRTALQNRIGNKTRYINQLSTQLKEAQ